jgi:thiopeptide-type bacteriocin biosynthesis protein
MTEWISVHVFYAGSLDHLLVEGVRGMLSRLRAAGAVRRWFFVRYWNGGRHLRLRVEPSHGQEVGVASIVQEELRAFVAHHPGGQEDSAAYLRLADRMQAALLSAARDRGLAEPEDVEAPQPTDSVQLRTYRYESERYGGTVARTLAEGHFWRSSELATTVVSRTLGRMDARASLAFELLAVAPVALALPIEHARTLLLESSRMVRYVRPDLIDAGQPPNGFVPFEAQRDELVALVRRARDHRSADPSSLAAVACELWAEELKVCDTQLGRLWADGQLTCHPHQVLLSYIHMLNNRLGIGFAEECHLYHLLARALTDIDGTRGRA